MECCRKFYISLLPIRKFYHLFFSNQHKNFSVLIVSTLIFQANWKLPFDSKFFGNFNGVNVKLNFLKDNENNQKLSRSNTYDAQKTNFSTKKSV